MTLPAQDLQARGNGSQAAGLVVSGLGLAALAGLAAWFSRRRRPDAAVPLADAAPATIELDPVPTAPRLALVRAEAPDAREERRILPPT